MQNVITLVEIRKFQGMKEAVFPTGTIVTPAAKDWAKEQGIAIICGVADASAANDGTGRQEDLARLVRAVAKEFERTGRPLEKEALITAVSACLDRLERTQRSL